MSDVRELRARLRGPVLTPTDLGYDKARAVWNGDIDRRPWAVARCRDAEDVASALGFARLHGLEVAVRGGGHGMSGLSVVDDGLVIDLGLLNQVRSIPSRGVPGAAAAPRWLSWMPRPRRTVWPCHSAPSATLAWAA